MLSDLNRNAQILRKKSTDAEKILWRYLRDRQHCTEKVRRQHPIGPYIVDFVFLEKKLIVELDGGQHQIRQAADKKRDIWLNREGYKVLRFWNNDVMNNLEGILETLRKHLL
jgi:very-short-patch-repair endonuclease